MVRNNEKLIFINKTKKCYFVINESVKFERNTYFHNFATFVISHHSAPFECTEYIPRLFFIKISPFFQRSITFFNENKGILILDEILTNNKPISNLNFALQNFLNFFYSFIAKSREYHEKLQNENEYESLLFYQLINNFKAVLEKIGAVWNISSAINTTAKELGYY